MEGRSIISRARLVAACALAALPCASSAAGAQSPQCAVPYGAMIKLLASPWHANMVDTAGTDAGLHHGKPTATEEISVGGSLYILSRGKWTKSPISVADMQQDQAEKMNTDKATCAHLRDESVNGENASVWSIHSDTEDGDTQSQLWVSKSRGVVMRTDIRIDAGGALGKRHSVSNYDFANIHAPAGAL